jgi:murein DD-endopeptidase MepM/ murein hydrolase activator NlpD
MRFRAALALAVLGVAGYFALSGRWPWRRFDVPSPMLATAKPAPAPAAFSEILDTLRRGETLSELFERQGIASVDVGRLAPVLDVRRLRAGLVFAFRRAEGDSQPDHIVVRTGPEQRLRFQRAGAEWNTEVEPIQWTPDTIRLEGGIEQSLYVALDDQVADEQLDGAERQRLAWGIADIYAWQVDFTRDIQPGDRFQVLIERLVSEDGETRFGRVLASDLRMSSKSLTAFRFETAPGESAFYDGKGNSLRRAFLRAPVEFRRISSNFSRARFHPVLGVTRRHEGTDYAAGPGTPVMAAGDGVVLRAGKAGGYGNLIELRHRNGITTRYGHLRGFARGLRAGKHVGQAEVIGYVGSTGLASGPHLHYEFRVGGVAQDSRRVALGNGAPIASSRLGAFEQQRELLQSLLYQQQEQQQQQQVASGEQPAPQAN